MATARSQRCYGFGEELLIGALLVLLSVEVPLAHGGKLMFGYVFGK